MPVAVLALKPKIYELPFAPRLTWQQILASPHPNPLKNLYWSAQQLLALREYAATYMQININLQEQQQGEMAKWVAEARKRAAAEVEEKRRQEEFYTMQEAYDDQLDDILESMRPDETQTHVRDTYTAHPESVARAWAAIYASAYELTLASLAVEVGVDAFYAAMDTPIPEADHEALAKHAEISEGLLSHLVTLEHSVDNKVSDNMVLAKQFVDRLARGLLHIGKTHEAVSPDLLAQDFNTHVQKIAKLAQTLEKAVEADLAALKAWATQTNNPAPLVGPVPSDVSPTFDMTSDAINSGEAQAQYVQSSFKNAPTSVTGQHVRHEATLSANSPFTLQNKPEPTQQNPTDDLATQADWLGVQPNELRQVATRGIASALKVSLPQPADMASELSAEERKKKNMSLSTRPAPPIQ